MTSTHTPDNETAETFYTAGYRAGTHQFQVMDAEHRLWNYQENVYRFNEHFADGYAAAIAKAERRTP